MPPRERRPASPRGMRPSGSRSRSPCGPSAACWACTGSSRVADDETLEAMLKDSASNQQEVTDRLGYQVREAVEVIIRSLDQIDQDQGRQLLAGIPETDLYEAALTVMMRLVFLFSAEERGLLLLGDPLYDEHYAVSTLVAQLQEAADQHGEEVLERRHDAWVRLLSTFRAVYGGVQHERLKLLPYAGNLFDPDRFPFLEGRRPGTTWQDPPSNYPPLPIDNRTVLHLLRSLQYLEMQGEARRLSFRALDIEQIGHVYEGLLDHTAKRATEPMLSLAGAKGDEPEVALAELERLRAKGRGRPDRVPERDETGKIGERPARKRWRRPVDGGRTPRSAAGRLRQRRSPVQPGAALRGAGPQRHLRPAGGDPQGHGLRHGGDRPALQRHALHAPQPDRADRPVHAGAAGLRRPGRGEAEGGVDSSDRPRNCSTSRSATWRAARGRSWSRRAGIWPSGWSRPGRTPRSSIPTCPASRPLAQPRPARPTEQLIPKDTDERLIYARRIVAQRCLYGVDKNPLAAEMAKLSLWLLTLAKDKPFTFLDHAIRCGDSLVGIRDIRQVQYFQLDLDQADRSLFTGPVMSLVDEAVALRKKIEALPGNTVEDVREKERLLKEAEEKTARLRYAADLLISVEFQPAPEGKAVLHNSMAIKAGEYVGNHPLEALKAAAEQALNGQRTFHWPLEFPEVVIDRGGFDAFVCNPPFMGGKKITGNLGTEYRNVPCRGLGPRETGECRSMRLLLPSGRGTSAGARTVRLPGDEHDRSGRHT